MTSSARSTASMRLGLAPWGPVLAGFRDGLAHGRAAIADRGRAVPAIALVRCESIPPGADIGLEPSHQQQAGNRAVVQRTVAVVLEQVLTSLARHAQPVGDGTQRGDAAGDRHPEVEAAALEVSEGDQRVGAIEHGLTLLVAELRRAAVGSPLRTRAELPAIECARSANVSGWIRLGGDRNGRAAPAPSGALPPPPAGNLFGLPLPPHQRPDA